MTNLSYAVRYLHLLNILMLWDLVPVELNLFNNVSVKHGREVIKGSLVNGSVKDSILG